MRTSSSAFLPFFLILPLAFATERASAVAKIRFTGSTSMNEMFVAVSREFESRTPAVQFINEASTSGDGVTKLINGSADLSRSSRPLTVEEIDEGARRGRYLRQTQVGYGAIAIVVHPEVGKKLKGLTLDQLRAIFYQGKIKNWSQITNGLSGKIRIFALNPKMSGTADAFQSAVLGERKGSLVRAAEIMPLTVDLALAVETTPLSIGFTATSVLNPEGKSLTQVAISSDGKSYYKSAPEDVRANRYPLSRDLFLISLGHPHASILEFLRFVMGVDGQEILRKHGNTPVI